MCVCVSVCVSVGKSIVKFSDKMSLFKPFTRGKSSAHPDIRLEKLFSVT